MSSNKHLISSSVASIAPVCAYAYWITKSNLILHWVQSRNCCGIGVQQPIIISVFFDYVSGTSVTSIPSGHGDRPGQELNDLSMQDVTSEG